MGMKLRRYVGILGTGVIALLPALPALAETCELKGGSASGLTRDFAEYEAFLIIRQVSGNWPFEKDRLGKPTYSCKQDGVIWKCRATAKICSG